MIGVSEAEAKITAAFAALPAESVALDDALGRTLAANAIARHQQPPIPVSMMDGYAIIAGDHGTRKVIGIAPAGHPFGGRVNRGEAVRIFTGAPVPDGADAVIMQEKVTVAGDTISFGDVTAGRAIRPAGMDFRVGDVLARGGQRLSARDLALLAADDQGQVSVRRRPVIAFAATGDELSRAGEPRKPGGIVASSAYGLKAMLAVWGAEPKDLGILPDTQKAIAGIAAAAAGADMIITLGGASVGDHDIVQSALGDNFTLDFWKIAMRPGKPLIFGRLGATPFMGLPGNPVSTLVTALLFVRPAIEKMLDRENRGHMRAALLSGALGANDERQDYLRASLEWREGQFWATALPAQDSSMLRLFAQADCLIVRKPGAPALRHGEAVDILTLD